MLNVVLFGPPGAGKGTQSEKLIEKYKLVHLSTGDLLRSQIEKGTELGKKAKGFMDQGTLVPDEVVIGMIDHKIKENKTAGGFIFDGFPRTVPQAVALDALLNTNKTPISCMVALEVGEEELTKRLIIRGKSSGRPDDQDESLIKNRIREYNSKTKPVAEFYSKQGKFFPINGIGSIDEIFTNISKAIDPFKK